MRIRICYDDWSLVALKKVCKEDGIKNVSKLRKVSIVNILNAHFSARYIYRSYMKYKGVYRVNNIDPITLEQVKRPWIEINQEGKLYRFGMTSFYEYMIGTGNFRYPFTSEEFSDEQLKHIDAQLRSSGRFKQSLFMLRYNVNKQHYYETLREEQELATSLDRQIGEVITESCQHIINVPEASPRHILSSYFIPNFDSLFNELITMDRGDAKHAIQNYIRCIKTHNIPYVNMFIRFLKSEYDHILSE